MISSDAIRGHNDLIVLSLLKEQDDYAYALSKKISDITNENYIIKETTLYSTFSRLEKQGYISSYILDIQSGGRERRYYKITNNGLEYLKEKLMEWEITKEVVENIIVWRKENE